MQNSPKAAEVAAALASRAIGPATLQEGAVLSLASATRACQPKSRAVVMCQNNDAIRMVEEEALENIMQLRSPVQYVRIYDGMDEPAIRNILVHFIKEGSDVQCVVAPVRVGLRVLRNSSVDTAVIVQGYKNTGDADAASMRSMLTGSAEFTTGWEPVGGALATESPVWVAVRKQEARIEEDMCKHWKQMSEEMAANGFDLAASIERYAKLPAHPVGPDGVRRIFTSMPADNFVRFPVGSPPANTGDVGAIAKALASARLGSPNGDGVPIQQTFGNGVRLISTAEGIVPSFPEGTPMSYIRETCTTYALLKGVSRVGYMTHDV